MWTISKLQSTRRSRRNTNRRNKTKREDIKKQLLNGELEEEIVKIKVEQEQQTLGMMGMENNPQMQDMLSQMMPKKKLKETCQLSQREKF